MKVLRQIGKSLLYAVVVIVTMGLSNMVILRLLGPVNPDTMLTAMVPVMILILSISYYVTHLGK